MYEFEAILLSESYKIKNVILTWENDSFIPKKLYSCNNNKKKTNHVTCSSKYVNKHNPTERECRQLTGRNY